MDLFAGFINKVKDKKGSERTLLSFIVVALPLLYILLVISSWKIYDVQYKYLDQNIENTVILITKTGVIHPNLDSQLKLSIEKILGDEYEIEYYMIDYDNLKPVLDSPNPIPGSYPAPQKIASPVGTRFKTGDTLYIQLKSTKEVLFSQLINMMAPGSTGEQAKIIIVHEGMIEVNAY